ncbi:hypothetical protein ACWC0C_41190 [Streptomyces sp. NPDC001709]
MTGELDNRYRNAALPVCNKFTVATVGTFRKFSPNTPAAVRGLEKMVRTEAMTQLSATASDAACRTSYSTAKTAW